MTAGTGVLSQMLDRSAASTASRPGAGPGEDVPGREEADRRPGSGVRGDVDDGDPVVAGPVLRLGRDVLQIGRSYALAPRRREQLVAAYPVPLMPQRRYVATQHLDIHTHPATACRCCLIRAGMRRSIASMSRRSTRTCLGP